MTFGVGKTDIGKIRKNNEDSIFISNEPIGDLPNLYIVSDGMGGHKAGEIASSSSISFFCDYVRENKRVDDILDFLISGVSYANKEVYKKSISDSMYFGMGATFSVCVIDENKIFIAHIGDSRIYLYNNELTQITADHTYVGDMVRTGILTEEEARVHPNKNIITRAIGIDENVQADGIVREIKEKNLILMCSDGLSNMLNKNEILDILKNDVSLDKKVNSLVEAANQNGGDDNISVLLIEKARH